MRASPHITAYLILFFGFFVLISCNERSVEYINHDTWMIRNDMNRARLKSSPKEVLETQYVNLNDTVFSDSLNGKANVLWNYKFDIKGNIISENIFFDSSFISDIFYRYDNDGFHFEYKHRGKGDTARKYTSSERISPSKFKRESFDGGRKRFTEFVTFSANGNYIKSERYRSDTIFYIVEEEYNDNLLKKRTWGDTRSQSEEHFYYSAAGFLDSQTSFVNKIPNTKSFYVNNEFGDPVYFERSAAGNVELRSWMKYQYDNKGNWVRMLEKREGDSGAPIMMNPEQKHPGYNLFVREIKY